MAEAFNALNRDNRRVHITDDGFTLRRLTRLLESITFLRTIADLPILRQQLAPMHHVRFNSHSV